MYSMICTFNSQILSQVKTKNTFKDNITAIDDKKKVNVHAGSEKSSTWTTHSYAEEVWSELGFNKSRNLLYLNIRNILFSVMYDLMTTYH